MRRPMALLSDARLADLLARTSRTFALTIPLLEEPLHAQVRVAYLLFRIVDTLEDAERLPRRHRLARLHDFAAILGTPREDSVGSFVANVAAMPPTANADYAELLHETPGVLAALEALGPVPHEVIRRHLIRTALRMASFVARADERGSLALRDLEDLRAYCYAVAGVVGEMLTELVLLAEPALAPAKAALEADTVAFGEALQLTNILKDATADAKEGRTYVPATMNRAEVHALAAEDLAKARRYIATLHAHGATKGVLAFHALPVRLAERTLARLRTDDPGAKISRDEVAKAIAAVHASLSANGSGL